MDQQRYRKAVARRVRTTRQHVGMSQAHLATVAGCSQQYLSQIERGDCLPSDQLRWALARELGVSVDMLFRYELDDEDEGAGEGVA